MESAPSRPNLTRPEVNGPEGAGWPGAPEPSRHTTGRGCRHPPVKRLLPAVVCGVFFFFLIPRSNQEVIGIPKKGHQVKMESRSCVRSLPPKMSAAASACTGLTGGRDGVRRDEWINTRGDEGMGGGGRVVFIRVMLRGASGSKRGRMLWFIQSRRRCGEGGVRGQGVCCPQHQASM